jgi:hypothetical protein
VGFGRYDRGQEHQLGKVASDPLRLRIGRECLTDASQSRNEGGPTVFGVDPIDTKTVTHLAHRIEQGRLVRWSPLVLEDLRDRLGPDRQAA